MLSPLNAKARWNILVADYSDPAILQDATVSDPPESNPCERSLRSVCWKLFLLKRDSSPDRLPSELSSTRNAFTILRNRFIHAAVDMNNTDPLAEEEANPWILSTINEGLRREIRQDVERCMQELQYFRNDTVRDNLSDILFVWCKENKDVGYRQGMHELAAVLLWVVEHDAVEGQAGSADWAKVLDSEYIVHDAYTLFAEVMKKVKSWYQVVDNGNGGEGNGGGKDSPIIELSKTIHEDLLKEHDPELAKTLDDLEILPQIFLIRWIRLLFGREYPLEQLLQLWDALFASSLDFSVVPYICVSMLIRIRPQILSSSHNTALTTLLNYPTEPPYHPTLHLRKALELQSSPPKSAPSSPPSRALSPHSLLGRHPLPSPLSTLNKRVTATLQMLALPQQSPSTPTQPSPGTPSKKELQLQREFSRFKERNVRLGEILGKVVGRMDGDEDARKWVEEVRLCLADEKRGVPFFYEEDEENEKTALREKDSEEDVMDVSDVGRKRLNDDKFAFLLG